MLGGKNDPKNQTSFMHDPLQQIYVIVKSDKLSELTFKNLFSELISKFLNHRPPLASFSLLWTPLASFDLLWSHQLHKLL